MHEKSDERDREEHVPTEDLAVIGGGAFIVGISLGELEELGTDNLADG